MEDPNPVTFENLVYKPLCVCGGCPATMRGLSECKDYVPRLLMHPKRYRHVVHGVNPAILAFYDQKLARRGYLRYINMAFADQRDRSRARDILTQYNVRPHCSGAAFLFWLSRWPLGSCAPNLSWYLVDIKSQDTTGYIEAIKEGMREIVRGLVVRKFGGRKVYRREDIVSVEEWVVSPLTGVVGVEPLPEVAAPDPISVPDHAVMRETSDGESPATTDDDFEDLLQSFNIESTSGSDSDLSGSGSEAACAAPHLFEGSDQPADSAWGLTDSAIGIIAGRAGARTEAELELVKRVAREIEELFKPFATIHRDVWTF